jgi:hypothetical protein
MAIRNIQEKPGSPINIDLNGPDGNAYVLIRLAKSLSKQLKYDHDRIERIIDEMTLTDYEGLLYTFDREFGLLVTLWR